MTQDFRSIEEVNVNVSDALSVEKVEARMNVEHGLIQVISP